MPEITTGKDEKRCLECGEPLGPGRQDRKYCSDICKTAYNNTKRKEPQPAKKKEPAYLQGESSHFRTIYQILIKNRTILHYYNEFFGDEIELRDLLGRGFNIKYFTSEYQADDTGVYRFCFDYGYFVRGENVYILYRPEETF